MEPPKGATVPDDHKKTAAQIEAEGVETATVTFGDLSFVIPSNIEDLDGEFLKYAADRDAYRIVQVVLDEKQFARFKALKPKVRDYGTLSDQIAAALGLVDSGN